MTDITLPKRDLRTTITFLGNTDINKNIENESQGLQLTVAVLLVLYMIYALLFTFSTMFGVLYLLQNHNAVNLTLASNTSDKLQNWIKGELQRMHIYEEKETLRILILVREQLEKCACHLNTSLNDAIQKQRKLLRQNLLEMYQPNGTVQLTTENYFQKMSEQYQKQNKEYITDFNDSLARNLHKMHTGYGTYMAMVADNGWLEFPREVFLKQLYDEGQNISKVSDKLEEFMAWMEIDNVGENAYILNRFLELMPSVDVSSLHAGALVPAKDSSGQVSISWFTFISHSTFNDLYITRSDQTDFQEIFKQPGENITNSMKQILYTVVIGVFVFLDTFVLANRFFWALHCLQQFKKGIRNNIPTDSITRQILFILTGIGYEKPDHTSADSYQLYNEKMAEFWGKNHELYIFYCQSSPESQKDILLQMRSHKQSMKADVPIVKKTTHWAAKSFTERLQKYTIYLYRLLISRFFWKFTSISAFYLFLCFVARGTDDLVTLEMASFLIDTDTMLNMLKSQNRIINSVIVQYCDHLNKFLREYQSYLDKDLDSITYLIQGFLTEQVSDNVTCEELDICF
ncbi:hypothetical protein ACJMK2_018358 [Sinanodonta woodiana]|uniref:Uncharacterized protein n=1 Tax=Sinanodonta woodiana TaxID=1069815 RepID=A0ABD3UEP2_SINWO